MVELVPNLSAERQQVPICAGGAHCSLLPCSFQPQCKEAWEGLAFDLLCVGFVFEFCSQVLVASSVTFSSKYKVGIFKRGVFQPFRECKIC